MVGGGRGTAQLLTYGNHGNYRKHAHGNNNRNRYDDSKRSSIKVTTVRNFRASQNFRMRIQNDKMVRTHKETVLSYTDGTFPIVFTSKDKFWHYNVRPSVSVFMYSYICP
jgi:hypothetical protein